MLTAKRYTTATSTMNSSFDKTSPRISRWDQDGAEYVRSTTEWIGRFARRLEALRPNLDADAILDVAQHASLDDDRRALSPERAVDDLFAPNMSLDE